MSKILTKKTKLSLTAKNPQEQRIRGLYQDLSAYYDRVQTLIDRLGSPGEMAVAAVLSEDLCCLVKECEEYLIGGCDLRSQESLESRSSTILEELNDLSFLSQAVQHSAH